MAYYCFDRCPEEKLSEIEKLALEIDLKPQDVISPGKSWIGQPFSEGFEGFLLVNYQPSHNYSPFILQTSSKVDHRRPDVLDVIKRFISICEPSQIYNLGMQPYNMAEFK
jgi:hypothetical protein